MLENIKTNPPLPRIGYLISVNKETIYSISYSYNCAERHCEAIPIYENIHCLAAKEKH